MKKKLYIPLILIFVLLVGALFFIIGTNELNPRRYITKDNSLEINKEDKTPIEENKETSGSTSEGGSSNGGGTGDSSSSSCSTKQISYSMINLNKISTCNQYQEGVCIDKTISCSIEIHNRDKQTNGLFEVELIFVESGKNKEEKFDSMNKQFNLDPLQFNLFEGSTIIQSIGINGLANKEINCFYNTLQVPRKEVC